MDYESKALDSPTWSVPSHVTTFTAAHPSPKEVYVESRNQSINEDISTSKNANTVGAIRHSLFESKPPHFEHGVSPELSSKHPMEVRVERTIRLQHDEIELRSAMKSGMIMRGEAWQ
jgi:hypothetical protein